MLRENRHREKHARRAWIHIGTPWELFLILADLDTAEHDRAEAIVQLQIGSVRLLSQVTSDAVATLGIVEGADLHVLIKSVSLEVRTTNDNEAHPRLTSRQRVGP